MFSVRLATRRRLPANIGRNGPSTEQLNTETVADVIYAYGKPLNEFANGDNALRANNRPQRQE
jgi:hypothetical protein